MAKKWILSSLIIFVVISLESMILRADVPALFILGDSTADVGTNSFRKTSARADFPHNGIDFPASKPTGRFSNGLNSADTLAKLMGFSRSPPPFLAQSAEKVRQHMQIQTGANFASGASGLLDGTGTSFGQVVSMREQVSQFMQIQQLLLAFSNQSATDSFLSKSLFLISVGSNDIFEFFASNSTLSKDEYIDILTSAYGNHLRMLYALGARKFGIISVPAIGCCPSQRALNVTGGCLENMNDYSRTFFSSLKTLLQGMKSDMEDMIYSLGNAYEMVTNFLENPLPFGFKELNTACCGNGTFNGQLPCSPTSNLCSNRDEYLFWDMYHPTQAAAKLAALTLYGGAQKFVTPINFRELAEA